MFNYDEITALAGDYPARAVFLSGSTIVAALAVLQAMESPLAWFTASGALTPAEQDIQEAMIAQAYYELTKEITRVIAGAIMPYPGTTAPTGFLLCDGSLYNVLAHPELADIIGTTFSQVGDPANSFRVPDLRGRTVIGTGTGTGLTARVLAAAGGGETHVLTTAEIPAHAHNYGIRGADGAATDNRVARSSDSATRVGTSTGDSAGGGGAHNNMQPFTVLTYIIATGGT